jgi:hypothetical protein
VKDDGHPRLHERPSKGKDFKENELTYYQTVFDMLRVFPGVMVSGSRVSLRGAGEPLAVIDGMETSVSALESINPHDVVRIEIVDSPASLIYGRKGINGAVVVFTKQGHHIIRGKLDFAMAGYLTPPLTKNVYRNFAPKENDLLMWHPQIFTNTQGETRVDLPLELANVPLLVEITALDGLGNFRRFSFEVNVGD